ncbi:putative ATP-binding cassette transporter [Faunimonas pinastri]|uniref:Putative ATP-binding cassette transporter n=1 Tax=Faunimonas pinastri TaxID=1855383 RepID=A0A1H8Z2L3_9HYPH|nr:ABC transporter ATP-binding protein/permease [Faunimonas pinastri]SEP58581.1 putative ATP-binding cassette transporter [Faunimonas pinastri]
MITNLSQRILRARGFLAKLWTLTKPYWFAKDRVDISILGRSFGVRESWIARSLLLLILALNVGGVYLSKLYNLWNGRFFDAIQNKNEPVFWHELKYWAVIATISIVMSVYSIWIQNFLTIRWRRWLTAVYFDSWLSDKSYYKLELNNSGTDNPEQRIQEDCDLFTETTLTLFLSFISQIFTLITFSIILWNLSAGITIPVWGGIRIPGFMMWVAIVYAGLGTWLTFKIGRPLVRINFDLQRFGADFRYRMTRIRDNAESVALYRGEQDERSGLRSSFSRIYDTFWLSMMYTKRLSWVTQLYASLASVFPFIVASPGYFAGQIQLGSLTRTADAFGTVQGSLSWFIAAYGKLAEWAAVIDRLTSFSDAMARTKVNDAARNGFEREEGSLDEIRLDGVDVNLPNGAPLITGTSMTLRRGEGVVLTGPSGSGKTTLFRTLAGLWPFGKGRVTLPTTGRVLFLPQKPYLPVGTLQHVLCYPDSPLDHTEADCRAALEATDLGHLAPRLAEADNWPMALSQGEQQRIGFARALLYRPDWVFLDEATSALDEKTEERMYRTLRERLPQAGVVSIAHKPSVVGFHERHIDLSPSTHRIRAIDEEAPGAAE